VADISELIFCEEVWITGEKRDSLRCNQHTRGFNSTFSMVVREYGLPNCTASPSGCGEGGTKGYKNATLLSFLYGSYLNIQHAADVAADSDRINFSGSAMMDQYWSLFSAYSAIWILLIFYIFSLGKKIKKLEEKLLLKESVKKSDLVSGMDIHDKGSNI